VRYPLPKLSIKQLEKLSDISSDVGLISLASVVLPAVLDRLNPIMLVLGLIATIFFWVFSIWLRR
jgi:hypothetical protein